MTAILVVTMTVFLVGILAFVTDFGLAHVNQRYLQNGVDAAALAVAKEVSQAPHTLDCEDAATMYDTAGMRTLAEKYFEANAPADAADLQPGDDGFEVTCESVGGVDRLVVHVKSQQESPAIFGGGVVPIGKSAKAIIGPAGTVVGLRPIAICQKAAAFLAAAPGDTMTLDVDNTDQGCGTLVGNWGIVDFDGTPHKNTELADRIRDGYDQPISLSPPIMLEGDPGFDLNSTDVQAALNHMMQLGDVVLPVYDTFVGPPDKEFSVTGFISVTPCRFSINGKSGPPVGTVNPICGGLPSPAPSDYIQVHYSDWIPISELSLTCDLGDDACDKGPRPWALAD